MATGRDKESSSWRAVGSVEGYIALGLTALFFLAPEHFFSTFALITIFACAFGLALGGVRFGQRGGRTAAWLVLISLTGLLLLIVVAGVVRWQQVRWYWGL